MKKYSLLIQLVIYIFLIMTTFSVVLGFGYYQTSSQAISQLTETSTRNSIQQGGQFISAYLQKLRQTSMSLVGNQAIKTYLSSGSEADKGNIASLIQSVLDADPDLVAAVLVAKDGRLLSTDEKLTMKTSSDMMSEPWYQAAIDQDKMMPVVTPARLEHLSGQDNEWVVSVTQEIVDKEGKNLGVLRLDIGYDTLAAYLDKLDLGQAGFPFIVNANHEFVYHPEKTVYASQKEMEAMAPYLGVKNGYTSGKSKFVYQYPIPDSQWILVGVSALDGLHALERQMVTAFLSLGLVGLVVCGGLVWFILRRWIKPIKDLQAVILKIGQGQHQLRAQETGAVELVDLSRQFNLMLNQIDDLMLSVQEKEQNIRQYELQALASQINPHFLYNTLDTIVWMAEFNDSRRVVDLTKSLAQFFRLALNNGHEQISLKNEIDHVRQYLFIQKQRYGDQLNYEIEELPAFANFQLPKLVLQPIVENAIYHGIKNLSHAGEILIRVEETDQAVVVAISDNGPGFEVTAQKAETKLGQVHRKGVGLANVDKRLALAFGSAYHMIITSDQEKGTTVALYLPKTGQVSYSELTNG